MSRSSVRSVSVPALAAVLAAALPAALAEAGNGSIRALNFDFQAGRFYPKTVSDDGSVAAGRWINYIDNRYDV